MLKAYSKCVILTVMAVKSKCRYILYTRTGYWQSELCYKGKLWH